MGGRLYYNEPFASYQIESMQPGLGFYVFVSVYTLLAFLFIAPLLSWSRNYEEKQLNIHESNEGQIEVEQSKNPDYERPSSTEDYKQISKPSLPKGGKEIPSANKKIEKESYNNGHSVQNSAVGDGKRDIKNQSSTSSSVLKKSNVGRVVSSSSIGSDTSDLLSKNVRHMTSKTVISTGRSQKSASLRSVVLRELDQSYPDQDPDFQNRIALRGGIPHQSSHTDIQLNANAIINDTRRNSDARSGGGSNQPTETSRTTETSSSVPSGVPSAATTSRLHQNPTKKTSPSDKSFSKLVLDVGGRRWKNRRPIGRADVIENVVANTSERQSLSIVSGSKAKKGVSSASLDPKKMTFDPNIKSKSLNKGGHGDILKQSNHTSKGMSDIASSILSEQYHQLNNQPNLQIDISLMKKHQLEQLRLQQQYQIQHQLQFFAMQRLQQQQRRYTQQRRYSRFGSRSVSEQSASVMSSIIDDISPDDAADANDPGRGNIFIQPDENYWVKEPEYIPDLGPSQEGCCSSTIEGLLLLAVPDYEKWNLLQTSIPLALGASSESLFRLVTVALISQYLDTRSMIAFLLVGLFMRLTSEELSSAIIDALSSFVQASMDRGSIDAIKSNYMAGQYIQLALVLQVLLNVPLLVFWVYFMEDFVIWLVNDQTIATFAHEISSILAFAYMIQALSRTLTVVFHICGHEHFESIIDLVAAVLQVIAIACVLIFVERADLTTVAGIQALIIIASAIAKIAYPAARGWMKPFRKGLIQNVALWNYRIGIWHLFKAAGPLLVGTVLEYGEWELLTLFIHRLGPAEVSAWALLGAFWDFFEALTEGIGEAAANQVTYLLSVGQVDRAKKLCYGSMFMAVTQAVLVTSVIYMSGQYLAVLFTTDPAIQHMMNNCIVLIGAANVIMAFSQITWSLLGAQGRFRLATFVIFFSRWFVTMPCALICIYVLGLDLNGVSGSLVVGYATACFALTVLVLSSDWDRLARLMQVMNQPALTNSPILVDKNGVAGNDANNEDPILGLVDLDNFDDSDDSSDGFGFGDYDDDNDGDENETSPSPSSSREKGLEVVED